MAGGAERILRRRIGSVSFLNAKPLIWGIDDDPCINLHLDGLILPGQQHGKKNHRCHHQ